MALEYDSTESMPRIDRMKPRRLDAAYWGIGNFFDSEPRFGLTKGVWRTVVGYSGGRYESPSFEDMGDHVEAVMVEYDPMTLSYGQLLEIVLNWRGGQDGAFCQSCQQTPSCRGTLHIFTRNEFEKRLAKAAVERYNLYSRSGEGVRIAMYKTFYKAEQWCQKHFLRMHQQLMNELNRIYRNEDRLIQSTLAARLNGLLGRRLLREAPCVPEDFEFYDLSACAADILKKAMYM